MWKWFSWFSWSAYGGQLVFRICLDWVNGAITPWNSQKKVGSAATWALHFDNTPVNHGDVFDNRKSQASSAELATARSVDSVKPLEESR